MRFIESLRDKAVGAWAGFGLGNRSLQATSVMAEEGAAKEMVAVESQGLAELELMIEDMSWREMGSAEASWQFTRRAIHKMTDLARLMFIANPLVKRAVTV